MIIECIIDRDGPTELTYASARHEFKHRPELTGSDTAKTCEVTASHAQDFFLNMGGFREYKGAAVEVPEQVGNVLTRETFIEEKNHMALKSMIRKCSDKELLQALIIEEAACFKPREWAGEALEKRLDELGD